MSKTVLEQPPKAQEVQVLAKELDRNLDLSQAVKLASYLGLLLRWNAKTNLVGLRKWRDILSELVCDSWHLADFIEQIREGLPENPLTLDFGAGAGLPGIPLRVFWEAGEYQLIEPRRLRAGFLRQAVAELRLKNTKVFEGTSEDAQKKPAWIGKADICLSRAFLPGQEFLELARNFLKAEGCCLIMAGQAGANWDVPAGFKELAAREYTVGGKSRGLHLYRFLGF